MPFILLILRNFSFQSVLPLFPYFDGERFLTDFARLRKYIEHVCKGKLIWVFTRAAPSVQGRDEIRTVHPIIFDPNYCISGATNHAHQHVLSRKALCSSSRLQNSKEPLVCMLRSREFI